jgi:hypothetical protein
MEAYMNAQHIRPIALLSLFLLCSCDMTAPSDSRGELLGSLKGENVDGYLFAYKEDEARTTSSLTNKAVHDLVQLGEGDSGLVLGYTRVKDNKTNAATTYKSEVVKRDASLALVVTDVAAGKIVDRTDFPAPGRACEPPGQFASLGACVERFNCTRKGALLCEANRTCKPQFAALTCCLTNGQTFSVHLVIPPTRITCLATVPDLESLVLTQR